MRSTNQQNVQIRHLTKNTLQIREGQSLLINRNFLKSIDDYFVAQVYSKRLSSALVQMVIGVLSIRKVNLAICTNKSSFN